MIWLQHALVLLILVLGPIWDYYEFKRLKASTDPAAKVKFYKKIVVAQWTLSALVLLAAGREFFWAPAKFLWMDTAWARSVGFGLLVGIVIGLLAPFLALSKPKGRAALRRASASWDFLSRRRPSSSAGLACSASRPEFARSGSSVDFFFVTSARCLGILACRPHS